MYKLIILAIGLLLLSAQTRAQNKFHHAVWADVTGNVQFAKSSLYFLGTGARVEWSKQLKALRNAFFYQAGYNFLIKKKAGAYSANTFLLNAGWRRQSMRAFYYSGAVGIQYWRETMRINLPEKPVKETFNSLIPASILAMGFCFQKKYCINLEYRQLYRFEPDNFFLTSHITVSVGYKF